MSYADRSLTRPGTTRRVRMADYDYGTPGYYFITCCTHLRQHYFGTISDGAMALTPAGMMVSATCTEIGPTYPGITVDCSVIMPNHIHLLIGIDVDLDSPGATTSVPEIVHWLKSTTSRRCSVGVRDHGWPRYTGRLWQTGYHDHVVRDDRELDMIRRYVAENVERWEQDTYRDGILVWGK